MGIPNTNWTTLGEEKTLNYVYIVVKMIVTIDYSVELHLNYAYMVAITIFLIQTGYSLSLQHKIGFIRK
jgi:hypothetical protein